MLNDFTRLDPMFVEGLTIDQVNNIFIARLLWGENDFMTAYNMTSYFAEYPGLDTWEKVYDKTWECIEKMMKHQLVTCTNTQDAPVMWDEIAAKKALSMPLGAVPVDRGRNLISCLTRPSRV